MKVVKNKREKRKPYEEVQHRIYKTGDLATQDSFKENVFKFWDMHGDKFTNDSSSNNQ